MLQTSRYSPGDGCPFVSEAPSRTHHGIVYSDEYFKWGFIEPPNACGQSPEIWICKDDDNIVGQISGLPVRVKVNDRLVSASWVYDLFVHPEFRRRGIAYQLMSAAVEDSAIVLGLGMGERSARVFCRLGCWDLGYIPVYARPFRCEKLLEPRCGNVLGRLFGLPANACLRLLSSLHSAALERRSMRLHEVESFDGHADTVWRMASPHYRVLCLRDAQQLNWRFASALVKPCYRRFYLMRGDAPFGYVVLSREYVNGVDAAVIVDYLCEPKLRRYLFSACVDLCATWGVTALYCTHLCPASRFTLLRLGFLPRTRAGKRFIASARGIDEKVLSTLQRRENWFVTIADSDAHSPEGIRCPPAASIRGPAET